MSFKLTIEVPDTKLMTTLRMLNGHKVSVESMEQYQSGWKDPRGKSGAKKGGPNPHSRASSRLTMTGKEAREGTVIEKGMILFEKLEKKEGIGTVTVKAFREVLVKNGHPRAVAQRSVTEGFLSYPDG